MVRTRRNGARAGVPEPAVGAAVRGRGQVRGGRGRGRRAAPVRGRPRATGPARERLVSPPPHEDMPEMEEDGAIPVQDDGIPIHDGAEPAQRGTTPIQMSSEVIQQVLSFLSGLAGNGTMPAVPEAQRPGLQPVATVAPRMEEMSGSGFFSKTGSRFGDDWR